MSTEPAMTTPPLDLVPDELKALKLWTLCYHPSSGQNPKRPIVPPKHYAEARTFQEIQESLKDNQLCGLLVSPHNDYVVVDIDQSEIPEHIAQFLSTHPTYIEYSPSGNKYHVFYRVPKDQFTKAQVKNTNGFVGEVFVRDQFITVTGQPHSLASNNKAILSLSYPDFASVYLTAPNIIDINSKEPTSKPNVEHITSLSVNYSLVHVKNWLAHIPAVPDKRIMRAYTQMGFTEVSAYDHWTTVAFALHDACARLDELSAGMQLFDEWSRKDSDRYEGPEDTMKKYFACSPDPLNGITVKTLQKLFRSVFIIWPEPVVGRDGTVTHMPVESSLSNYMELLSFYDISFQMNVITKAVTLTGDAEIVSKYFRDMDEVYEPSKIASYLWSFFQDHGFKKVGLPQVQAVTKKILDTSVHEFNPIKDWITSAPWDHTPRINQLLSTIAFDDTIDPTELQLYRSLIKKNLMGVIRNNFYTGNFGGTSGIVILQGRENTRKSTWLKLLLPHDLRDKYVGESQIYISGQSSVKELQLEASLFQMIIYDEVERIMQGKNSSILKNLLTQDMDMYRPLYGKVPIKTRRRAIFWGTTNEVSLQMSNTGNRRIAIIPVQFCDTEVQAQINMQQVYAELLHEYLNAPAHKLTQLWQLSTTEITVLDSLNNEHKAESSLDIVLQEMFDFSYPFVIEEYYGPNKRSIPTNYSHPRVFNTKAITEMINVESDLKVNHAHMKQVLHRLLGAWTQTNHKAMQVNRTSSVRNGLYVAGPTQKWWLMPPRKTPFTSEDS